jgi:carbohydrate diacid regulator
MRVTEELAKQIIDRAHIILDRQVLVSDNQGMVLGDTKYSGQIIVDALRACQEGKVIRSNIDDNQVAWCPFVYENETAGALGILEQEGHITPEAISLLQGLSEVLAHQHFVLEHMQSTETIRANFLKEALGSNTLKSSEVYRQADILQLNLREPQAIILIEVEDFEAGILKDHNQLSNSEQQLIVAETARSINDLIRKAFNNHQGNIACYIGENIFLLSKGIGGEGLTLRNTMRFLIEKAEYVHKTLSKNLSDKTLSVGVGQYYPEFGGLRKSYQEAKLSLDVGTKVWGPGRVYHIKQVGMFVTLANVSQDRKAELAHQILYPLLKDEQLYKTVQTFLSSGLNLTDAAEKLHVHRNTLIYRLDKTKKVIGLDPRVFDDALQIKLGLMFYQEV